MSKFVTLHGFGGGGDTELNFQVIGGTTEPANPTENMIWVNTDIEIIGWYFSAAQPENMVEGEVWFSMDRLNGNNSFNTLKKNTVMVYPISAKQYINSALVNVPVQIYQDEKWNELWDGYLYKRGNEYEGITGGWQSCGVNVATSGTITKNADSIICPRSAANAYQGVSPVNKIDLTGYSTLHVIYKHATAGIYITIANSYPTSTYAAKLYSEQIQNTEVETTVDISSLKGEYYINIATNGVYNDLYIYEVWLT